MKKVMLLGLSLLCFFGEGFAQNNESAPCQKEIEICFLIDATGSMRSVMNALKTDLSVSLAEFYSKKSGWKTSAAVVLYRDLDEEYLTRQFQMDADIDAFSNFIKLQYAVGGGDELDHFSDGFKEAINGIEWSVSALPKFLIVLSDNEVAFSLQQQSATQAKGIEAIVINLNDLSPHHETLVPEIFQKIEESLLNFDFLNDCDQDKTAFSEREKVQLEIRPNPAVEQCLIQLPSHDTPDESGKWKVELKAENGKTIYSTNGVKQVSLEVSELPAGAYFIHISNKENHLTEKLVVLRP